MAKRVEQIYDPFFVENFPHNRLSLAQQSTYKHGIDANNLYFLWSRQVGKSNLASYMAWNRMIDYKETSNNTIYAVLHPQANMIEERMLEDILLEPFGGGVIPKILDGFTLNSIYIKPPEWWWEDMEVAFANDPSLEEEWNNKMWLLFNEDDKEWYVKLFTQNIDQTSKKGAFIGKLFNGATVVCSAVNEFFANVFRGAKLQGVYGEEMGEYKKSPFDVITPALQSQDNSWTIFAGTPNGDKPQNWLYEQMVMVKQDENAEIFFENGVDYYISNIKTDLAPSAEDLMNENGNEIVTKQIHTKIVWSVGQIHKIFPYVYDGPNRFAKVQSQRKFPDKAYVKRDEYGTVQKDSDGYPIYVIEKDKPNPAGVIDEDQYGREYKMQFVSVASMVFPNFNINNHVIPFDSYDWDSVPFRMLGYDHGVGTTKITKTISGNTRSASCKAKIACFPVQGTDTYQYVIYDIEYIEEPTKEEIALCFLDAILSGMCIVADSSLWKRTIQGNDSDLMQIIKSNPELANDPRTRTNVALYKSYKMKFQDKYNNYNKYFKYNKMNIPGTNMQIEFRNPANPMEKGYKVMITDNCLHVIQFLSNHMYKIDSDGSKKPGNLRDDSFDAPTYPIDTFESPGNKKIRKDMRKFWESYSRVNSNMVYTPKKKKISIII